MASELRVDTLKDSSGNNSVGMSYVANGSAKAWNHYTQVSSVSITDSFNVSSISDITTGVTQTSFTTSMANAAYIVSGSHNLPGGNSASIVSGYDNSGDFATGTVSISTFNASSGRVDCSKAQMAVNGELA